MARYVVTLFFVIVAFGAIAYLLYERSVLKKEITRLRQQELQLKKEAEAEKAAWTKLYRDCVDDKNALISKLKDISVPDSGNSSN